MKTICARINPDFKRTQLLPVILNFLPSATDAAARPFGFILPATANDQAPRMCQQPQSERAGLSDK